MLLDLNELFSRDNHELKKTVSFSMEQFTIKMGTFLIEEKTPIELTLFHKSKKKIKVDGNMQLVLQIPCDRCLKSVSRRINIVFTKEFGGQEAGHSEEDAQYIVDNTLLDVDKIIYDEILLHWPVKNLCKEECKGICNRCGNDLNVKDCGCDRVVLDPRMAAIQDIFKNANQ